MRSGAVVDKVISNRCPVQVELKSETRIPSNMNRRLLVSKWLIIPRLTASSQANISALPPLSVTDAEPLQTNDAFPSDETSLTPPALQ